MNQSILHICLVVTAIFIMMSFEKCNELGGVVSEIDLTRIEMIFIE